MLNLPLYSLRRNCAMWLVCMPSGMIVFRSLSKKRCQEFIAENQPCQN